MGLKHIDLDAALRRLAERKIEEAIREGKFNNLPGFGKPLNLEPIPAEENARMRWWALRLLKQNDVIPEEVVWRKRIDRLKDELPKAMTEARVTAIVTAINGLVRQLNTMGTTALSAPVVQVSLEEELARWRDRLAAREPKEPPLPLSAYGRREPPPLPSVAKEAPQGPTAKIRTCANPMCGFRNPLAAQYCRRCGTWL
jgi:Domain of unknown function (DUF1992)